MRILSLLSRALVVGSFVFGALGVPTALFADEPPPSPAPPQSPSPLPGDPDGRSPAQENETADDEIGEEGFQLGVITGSGVNLRVGPRIDQHPITQLDDGTVVLVVERLPGWVGVRLPRGFPAALCARYVEPTGPAAVRVRVSNLNLRVRPPEAGRPMPDPFRDRPALGALLPVIDEAGADDVGMGDGTAPEVQDAVHRVGAGAPPVGAAEDDAWLWVLAPEDVRAYVHESYVEVLGPAREHTEALEAARRRRADTVAQLSRTRRAVAAARTSEALMSVIASIQEELGRVRSADATDRLPVVELAARLDDALRRHADARPDTLALARALRGDLERELELRVLRHDAEMARLQGRPPVSVPVIAPSVETCDIAGELRYEPTPGWTRDGVYLLWIDDEPRYVLRLTTGGELPHPDFAAHANAGLRRIHGTQPGDRMFGLPILDVQSIRVVDDVD